MGQVYDHGRLKDGSLTRKSWKLSNLIQSNRLMFEVGLRMSRDELNRGNHPAFGALEDMS